jgi:F-type H+-transporting ATPase subunit delta
MQNETVARRYAIAIFGLAKERNKVEAVGRGLHAALDAIVSNDDVRRLFMSPVAGRDTKLAFFAGAFERALDEVALHAVLLLIRKRREALLGPIAGEYDRLELAASGREPLEITSARKLAPAELDQLVARLSRLYGRTFDVKTAVDPALLGGLRITMGDRRIDGTVAGRLDEFARELFGKKELSLT